MRKKLATLFFGLRFMMVVTWAGLVTGIRRLFRRPRVRSWDWRLEWTVDVMRRLFVWMMRYDLKLIRALMDSGQPRSGTPAGSRRERIRISDVPVQRFTWLESARDDSVFIYLHGGGYAFGSSNTHAVLTARLARLSGRPVYSVDYRLAPEHPFPAAVDDAQAVYESLLSQGYEARKIAIAGDSAGGGLTMSLLVRLKERGLPQPGAAVAISPWADLGEGGRSRHDNTSTDYLPMTGLLDFAPSYLGDTPRDDPSVSTVHADLSGLPPLLIQAGGAEILLDDAKTLARRAREQGVDVELEIYEDMPHVWHVLPHRFTPEARKATERVAEWVRLRLDS